MGNLIILNEKPVIPKGLIQNNKISQNKLKKYFFPEDYANLKLLQNIQKLNFPIEKPTLIYPGCGADILFR